MSNSNLRHIATLSAFLFCLLSAATASYAQDNRFGIDDSCYTLYEQCDSSLGTPDCRTYIERLRSASIEAEDTKAETLSYVLDMRNAEALGDDSEIDRTYKALKEAALRTGYMQYYYYAFDQLATYSYNHGLPVRAMDVTAEMLSDAESRGNEYGMWTCYRFLARFYSAENDLRSARRAAIKSLEIAAETDDPTILSQGLTKPYIEVAETFEYGQDSLEMFLNMALHKAITNVDSVRVSFSFAKLAAWKEDKVEFERSKSYCFDPANAQSTDRFVKDSRQLLPILEALLDNKSEDEMSSMVVKNNNFSYNDFASVGALALKKGYYKVYSNVQNILLERLRNSLEASDTDRLNEISAGLGASRLTQQLNESATTINTMSRRMNVLLIGAIILVILFSAVLISSLYRAKRNAEDSDQSKTRFVQNMSHEIRTPLNAVVGFSQLLSLPAEMLSDEEREEYGGYITNNSTMLTMLIDDILDMADMDSGNYRIIPERCQVNEMARAAMHTVEYRVPPGVNYTFSTDAPDDLTTYSDPRRVQQVIINYLTNACKHTAKGEIHVEVSISETPGMVTYSVRDTGDGIPADQAENIFERFTKLNAFKQGSGLGLNICRTVSARLGGSVSLDTSYTDGARFLFILPLKEKPAATA